MMKNKKNVVSTKGIDNVDAVALFIEIKNNMKSEKAKISLDRVQEAINFFIKEKTDFSVASIGRFCESKWDSPKVQSIRNSSDLMRYIKFMQSNNTIYKSSNNDSKTVQQELLDNIESEEVKAYIILQNEKLKMAEKKYNDLKSAMSKIAPVDIDKFIQENSNMDNPIDLVSANTPIISVDDSIDKEIDIYFVEHSKNSMKSGNKKVLKSEQDVRDFLVKSMISFEHFEEFISILNTKFLDKLGIQLVFKNNMVVNLNTGSVIFEF